ncbi:MAG: ParB/RepB/Spo0J family partition protein [Chloroflexota bacterium]
MSKRILKPVDLNLDEPGKDLSRMFAASLSNRTEARHASMLPVDKLLDNPYQPRLHMDDGSLDELSRVIGGQGFQGVLVARPHPEQADTYQLTAGHRRREAAKRAGLSTLPVVLQDLSDEEMVTLAITENIQRDDLTPLEEGRIFLLMSDEMGYTLEQMSREIGKTIGYIYNRLRAAKAPDDIQALVQEKPDSLRAVANLIKVEDPAERAEIIGRLLDGRMTTDDLPSYIKALATEHKSPTLPHETHAPTKHSEGSTDRHDAGMSPSRRFDYDATTPLDPAIYAPPTGEVTEVSTVLVDGVQVPVERSRPAHSMAGRLGSEERAERARIRARRSRISRLLSLMLSLNDSLRDDETFSEEERLELATLAVVAERLCYRFEIRKDG